MLDVGLVSSYEHCQIRQNQIQKYFYWILGISLILRLFSVAYSELLAEEAYYWNYSEHLDFGYLDHPPMIALLIKISTSFIGVNEFGVRLPSLICWFIASAYSFKLTNLISPGAGKYTLILLSILPFFFLQSLVITPDQPLLVCWSAALYCLYRCLILEEPNYWYAAGIWIGLGMISKYTIVLVGASTLIYLILIPSARKWFLRKEPYIAALIAILLFAPVIYWNATHHWASFIFQGSRRIQAERYFTFHHFIGLLILFLMPIGILGLFSLIKTKSIAHLVMPKNTKRFIQIYTFLPLLLFGFFSLGREVKFNWIGPGLLALIPWLAILIEHESRTKAKFIQQSWFLAAIGLPLIYALLILCMIFGRPELAHQRVLSKFISWSDLTLQLNSIAQSVNKEYGTQPYFVPLDLYNVASELAFYQKKLLVEGKIKEIYPVIGRHLLGEPSLMYSYWAPKINYSGKFLILISSKDYSFNLPLIKERTTTKLPVATIWSHSQGLGREVTPYYYQLVEMK